MREKEVKTRTLERALDRVLMDYAGDPFGIHGIAHWGRVFINATMLASNNGGDVGVAKLFAILHDSKRLNDHDDPDHGPRAAEFARKINRPFLHLSRARLEVLCEACEGHTSTIFSGNPTVQACWDADRLDLARPGVLVTPDPDCMNTEMAKDPDVIKRAMWRSRVFSVARHTPPFVASKTIEEVHGAE